MKAVVAIKDVEVIGKIKVFLISKNRRDYMISYLGIHTDLNINDLLALEVSDVKGKDYFQLDKRKIIISAMKLKDFMNEKADNIVSENGYLPIIYQSTFSLDFIKVGTPQNMFSEDDTEQLMKDTDDRVNNTIAVDENSEAHIVSDHSITSLYPVRLESWCAGNKHV